MLHIFNMIILYYVLPLILSYLVIKLYFTYNPLKERPGLGIVLCILTPGVNIFAFILYVVQSSLVYSEYMSRIRKDKSIRTIGEKFLRINKRGG